MFKMDPLPYYTGMGQQRSPELKHIFCLFISMPLGPERKGTQVGWGTFLPFRVSFESQG